MPRTRRCFQRGVAVTANSDEGDGQDQSGDIADDEDFHHDYSDDPDRCETCGKFLSIEENDRYFDEIDEWGKTHFTTLADTDVIAAEAGILRECNKCAVATLRARIRREASRTFMQRAVDGESEGFILVAVVILALLFLASILSSR
jgi:hypothetical protein